MTESLSVTAPAVDPDDPGPVISAPLIVAVTAGFFDVDPQALTGESRARALSHPRQVAMWLCRDLTAMSLPAVGAAFSRDHTTVLYAEQKIRDALATDTALAGQVGELTGRILAAAKVAHTPQVVTGRAVLDPRWAPATVATILNVGSGT